MLLLIGLISLTVGSVFIGLACVHFDEWYKAVAYPTFGFGIIVSGIMFACLIFNYIVADANLAGLNEQYQDLVYMSETSALRDDFGLLNKEYFDDVRDWNETLKCKQELTHSFWVGIVIPDYFDELETIDLDSIVYTTE